MIAYKKTSGVVTDLRLVADNYVAAVGETTAPGDALPDPATLLSASEKLDAVKAAKRLQLASAASAQIAGGYLSSALGTPFAYPSTPTDQANMSASVVDSLTARGLVPGWTTLFMCRDQSSGAWARRMHNAAQIQKAGQDGKDAIVAALNKLDTLRAKVDAATDITTVNAITW
jgi:hypothetical protein